MDAKQVGSMRPAAAGRTAGKGVRALACLALWWSCACGDTCRALSDDVCRCAYTRADEQRCLRHVRALSGQQAQSTSAAARERCASLADTCTCEALAAGNLAACGLTEAAPP